MTTQARLRCLYLPLRHINLACAMQGREQNRQDCRCFTCYTCMTWCITKTGKTKRKDGYGAPSPSHSKNISHQENEKKKSTIFMNFLERSVLDQINKRNKKNRHKTPLLREKGSWLCLHSSPRLTAKRLLTCDSMATSVFIRMTKALP